MTNDIAWNIDVLPHRIPMKRRYVENGLRVEQPRKLNGRGTTTGWECAIFLREQSFELPEVAVSRVPNILKKYEAQDEHSVQWICKSFQAMCLGTCAGRNEEIKRQSINFNYKVYLQASVHRQLEHCLSSLTQDTDRFPCLRVPPHRSSMSCSLRA